MEAKVAVVAPTIKGKLADAIISTMNVVFHGVRDPSWGSKLIMFPTGGLLWGLHLYKKENSLTSATGGKLVASLLCYGPIDRSGTDWSLNFSYTFNMFSGNTNCSGPLKRDAFMTQHKNCISNSEWGVENQTLLDHLGSNNDIRITVHLFIDKTTGIDEDVLRHATIPTSHAGNIGQLTPLEIGKEVVKTFTELLCEEKIEFSREGYKAAQKIGELMAYPRVLDIIRQYIGEALLQRRGGGGGGSSEQARSCHGIVNLDGFDYAQNPPHRRARMHRCNEEDVVAMFQHLSQIAFLTSNQ